MKSLRALAVLAIVAIAVACSDRTPAPTAPPPQADLIGSLLSGTGLLKCSNLPYAASTQTIGPEGGSISAGPHTLRIPAGALERPTTITMTAPTGTGVNAVHFEPEGLQFGRSAALTMSYANCSLLGALLPKRIAYTNDDHSSILYWLLSLDNIFARKVTGKLDHFSDYVVGW
jgi:hypothetical protein